MKKTTARILSVLLTLFMLCSLLPVGALAVPGDVGEDAFALSGDTFFEDEGGPQPEIFDESGDEDVPPMAGEPQPEPDVIPALTEEDEVVSEEAGLAGTYTVTLIAYDKTNGKEQAGGEVAFADSGKGTTITGNYQENNSREVGVYPASDYTFSGWAKGSPTGEIVSTVSPYTFTVTENVTLYALFEKVTTYPVWVGGTQVTSANKGDILGDGGKAKYEPATNTLTLDNPAITTTHENAVIYSESIDLTVTYRRAGY